MTVDIHSAGHCNMLLERIEGTLVGSGFDMSKIRRTTGPLHASDREIFAGLCAAILSIRAVWSSVQENLPAIGRILYGYNISAVAGLSDVQLQNLLKNDLEPLHIQSARLRQGLVDIRDDARVFQTITHKHGSVRDFILAYLDAGRADDLRAEFMGARAEFKLSGVGPAICSEFFNNIGIDEFKADSNTTRFFERINVASAGAPADKIRATGIAVAESTGKPRVYVDSLIWHFCAEDEGEICRQANPKCSICGLRLGSPRLCTY